MTLKSIIHICVWTLLLALNMTALPSEGRAQTSCSPAGGEDGNGAFVPLLSANAGVCNSGVSIAFGYDNPSSFAATDTFIILLPDSAPRSGAINPVKVRFTDGTNILNISSITCAGGTIGGIGTQVGTISLADGASCALTVGANGDTTGYSGGMLSRNGAVYTITAGTLSGGVFGGTFPPGSTTGLTSLQNSQIVASLQNSLNSVTPGLLDGASIALNGLGNGSINGSGVNFTPTGLGLSQSRIDHKNPLDRDYGPAFSPRGYFEPRTWRQRNNGFNFSVDLNQMARGANDKPVAGQAMGMGAGPYRPRSRINSFVTGQYVEFDDDERNADRGGHLWVATGGLGVSLSDRTTIGVFSRYREGEATSNALIAKLDAEYWGGGLFLSTTLGGGLRVTVAGLYERGDNHITISGDTGSFNSRSTTIEGRVDKRLTRRRIWIEPAVTIRYTDTEQDNYTDSTGTLVVNQDLTLGRLTYGPTIGATITRGTTKLKPFTKINGVWDFENEGSFATSTAGTFTSGDHAINLGGGIEIEYGNGLVLRAAGSGFTFDTELDGWSVSGGLGAPFAVFGFENLAPGFVSLNFASNGEDTSTKARIKIPLGGTE